VERDKTVRRDLGVSRKLRPAGRLWPAGWVALLVLVAGAVVWAQEPAAPVIKSPEDMTRAGLFKESPAAIQGRTVRGETILDAPPFQVLQRTDVLEMYPCADCHEGEPVNHKERQLKDEHEAIVLEHGSGRFWCLTCHGSPNKSTLTSLKGAPIDFNQAYILCGQCHFQRQKDWYFGGHGKRVGAIAEGVARIPEEVPVAAADLKVEERDEIGTWEGERALLSCPACHDPHSPSIKPFKPAPPPQVRKGLKPARLKPHEPEPVWVRLGEQGKQEKHGE